MKTLIESGFTGNVEAYDVYCKLYNRFAERLEELGADDSMFSELMALCEASRQIYI
ncbi:MAG: hypothetical protein H9W82_12280 [Lactobacillus sp.]|nr:hypothetical protein [Lactobacillus sp.]